MSRLVRKQQFIVFFPLFLFLRGKKYSEIESKYTHYSAPQKFILYLSVYSIYWIIIWIMVVTRLGGVNYQDRDQFSPKEMTFWTSWYWSRLPRFLETFEIFFRLLNQNLEQNMFRVLSMYSWPLITTINSE